MNFNDYVVTAVYRKPFNSEQEAKDCAEKLGLKEKGKVVYSASEKWLEYEDGSGNGFRFCFRCK